MVIKQSKPRRGDRKPTGAKILSPHPGLDSILFFTYGFTVGYFLLSLRDLPASRRSIFFHFLRLVGDDAGAAAVGKIGIRPLEQHGGPVAEADEKN